MLSVFDLLERGTMTEELAGFSLYWISRGASFLVGANPGGAGKTTVMCALLNFVPADVELIPATVDIVESALTQKRHFRRCFICHEIGSGPWFAYLWGESLREYFRLFDYDYILATNLHADDIDEARYQICDENRVPEKYFRRVNLLYFIRVLPGYVRKIDKVYYSDGTNEHQLVYHNGRDEHRLMEFIDDQTYFQKCCEFITSHIGKIRTIEETRQAVMGFLMKS